MTAERIREFFDEHYLPGNMVVAVAGDLDHERRGGRARRAVRWQQGRGDPVPDGPRRPRRILAVTRRATEQAHVVLAARSVDR